ncbi:MAG: secondary thiamine-phosphate synthase enzyme YjbQ [Campylobacterales bacterium]|nr:secondary thiamine-phosphate synthase enzyme YjbQ [Campylobacterales bacterium]
MEVVQKEISLGAKPRGFHLITREIEQKLDLKNLTGLAHIHIKHTSASLTLNENADPTVRDDFESFINHMVPESFPYSHDYEGADDMPAHLKGSIFGSSITIPVTNGQFNLGTWQGIYLGEHRDYGGSRKIVITLLGE